MRGFVAPARGQSSSRWWGTTSQRDTSDEPGAGRLVVEAEDHLEEEGEPPARGLQAGEAEVQPDLASEARRPLDLLLLPADWKSSGLDLKE